MPLVLRMKTSEGIANINLFYSGKHLSVAEGKTAATVTGALDDDIERANVEIGFEPSAPMLIAMAWEGSASQFLTSSKNLKLFLIAIHEQGPAALGVTMDELRHLFHWAAEIIITGDSDFEGDELIEPEMIGLFFEMLDTYFPEHRARRSDENAKFDWPTDAIKKFSDWAMEYGNCDAIRAMETFGDKVFKLKTNERCKKYDKKTRVVCAIEVCFYVIDALASEWVIRVDAHFTDSHLLDWFIDEEYSSQDPDDRTRDALECLGMTSNNEAIIDTIEDISIEPETYQPDGSGDYAVFISGVLYGLYETEDEAIMFAEMSNETIKRENLPEEVHVYQRPELYCDDDGDEPYFEEDEEECWNLIW